MSLQRINHFQVLVSMLLSMFNIWINAECCVDFIKDLKQADIWGGFYCNPFYLKEGKKRKNETKKGRCPVVCLYKWATESYGDDVICVRH